MALWLVDLQANHLLQAAAIKIDFSRENSRLANREKDHLDKSVCKMIEICRPNVIMVEKKVSRDIQELLLKEGVTLVLDMKLHRLEKIARCLGSPILSFSDVLSRPRLKLFDYFHIEKVMEEHNHTVEAGKRPSKNLMYLEGFHKPLGCKDDAYMFSSLLWAMGRQHQV